jgi:Tfp pilus assembly protein PilF
VAGEARFALGGSAREYAAECFEKAMTAEVAWPNLKLRIALAHLEWGNTRGAGDLLRRLLDEEPNLPLAWILAGDAARLSGERKRAEECYRRACALAPELTWLREWMGWRGRARETLRALRRRVAQFLQPVQQ